MRPVAGTTEQDIGKIIVDGDYVALVEKAKALGEHLARTLKEQKQELTTSQIRNVFGAVKKIEMRRFDESQKKQVVMLLPKLAYAAGKPGAKKGVKDLKEILSEGVRKVEGKEERFTRFVDFFEAILAYHREAGGQ